MGLARQIGRFFKTAGKDLGKRSVKSPTAFKKLVKKSETLGRLSKKLGEKLITKKNLTYAVAISAVGVTAEYVTDYIRENSGCFLYDKKGTRICKVRGLSCCSNTDVPKTLKFCDEGKHPLSNFFKSSLDASTACSDYVDESESCCKFCECIYHKCDEGVKMKCEDPTIGEAMSHIAGTVGSSILSTTLTIFPFLKGFGIFLLCIVFLIITLRFIF